MLNGIKDFFKRYSYDSAKMLLDQVAISIFGLSLAMASVHADNNTLLWATSIGSVLFYLFLLYGAAWKMGDTDRNPIAMGHRKFNPFTGCFVSLVANSLNLIVAVTFMINSFMTGGTGASGIIGRLLNGMYLGLMTVIHFDGDYLHAYWWMYFIVCLPALLVSTAGYIMGAKGFVLTKMMTPDMPASDRPTRKEIKERKNQMKNKEKDGRN